MKFLKLDYILGLLLLGGTNAFAPVSKTVMTPTTSTSLNLESLEQKTPDYEETERLLQTYSEKSRVYRRNVYTSADWVKSRRSNRFVRNILTVNFNPN
jgi:hypothetical protein